MATSAGPGRRADPWRCGAAWPRRVLGQPDNELVTRISGLLLTAIPVQLMTDAVREFIREGV
jgi:small neutral amino acid transporter SnatA (MarC family)